MGVYAETSRQGKVAYPPGLGDTWVGKPSPRGDTHPSREDTEERRTGPRLSVPRGRHEAEQACSGSVCCLGPLTSLIFDARGNNLILNSIERQRRAVILKGKGPDLCFRRLASPSL